MSVITIVIAMVGASEIAIERALGVERYRDYTRLRQTWSEGLQ